jgi:uncharacterized protein (TIGR02996 family)
MNDETFIRAIGDAPDEDAPRLDFADFLQGQGDEARAEHIRAEVRLARMAGDDPQRPALEARVAELQYLHKRLWLHALPKFPGIDWAEDTVRGLHERIVVSDVEAIRRHGDAIRSAAPVRSVVLKPPARLAELARAPFMRHVEELSAHREAADSEGLGALANSPHAARLRSLAVHPAARRAKATGRSWGADLLRLLASPAVPRLEVVEVSNLLLVPPEGWGGAAGGPPLRALVMKRCRFGSQFPAALFALPATHTLERLHVSDDASKSGDAMALALGAATDVRGLRYLCLDRTGLSAVGAAALGTAHLGSLRELHLPKGCLFPWTARELRRWLSTTAITLGTGPR